MLQRSNMKFKEEMFNIEFLIFSSHKTATQSVSKTLQKNGFSVLSCHSLRKGMQMEGLFKEYLDTYVKNKNKKLIVISSFREPIERHISSFFQYYGTRPINRKEVNDYTETTIYNKTIPELQLQFTEELNNKTCPAMMNESILDIVDELDISLKDLKYSTDHKMCLYEKDNIQLYIFDFRMLTHNMETILSNITGKNIKVTNSNTSSEKWYDSIYKEFKSTLYLSEETIKHVYALKKDLIEMFYEEGYDESLKKALTKYSHKPSSYSLKTYEKNMHKKITLNALNSNTINAIRDLALQLESEDIHTAHQLMSLAYSARPTGAFMLKKLNEYHNKINPSPLKKKLKNMFERGEIAIIPIGFRCFTKIDICSTLEISQPTLPFDNGFFPPSSISSILQNPTINLTDSNHSVCMKYENHYDTNLGLGIKFKTSTYNEINTLATHTDIEGIKQYLDGTFGYYTLDPQHNYILAHYNWHPFASQSHTDRIYNPKHNIKQINTLLNTRIQTMFHICNHAKYIFFVFGEYQDYHYMSIDTMQFDLHNYQEIQTVAKEIFSAKSFVLNANDFENIDMLFDKVGLQK